TAPRSRRSTWASRKRARWWTWRRASTRARRWSTWARRWWTWARRWSTWARRWSTWARRWSTWAAARPTLARPATEPRSVPPEQLPRVVLEIADELGDVVVHLFVHQERADGALAAADVRDDRVCVVERALRFLGDRVGARDRGADVRLLVGTDR